MSLTQEFVNDVQNAVAAMSPFRPRDQMGHVTLICASATKVEPGEVAPVLQIVTMPQLLECFGIPPAGFQEKQVLKSAQAFLDAERGLFRNLTRVEPESDQGQELINSDAFSYTRSALILGHPVINEYADKSIYMNVAMGINENP